MNPGKRWNLPICCSIEGEHFVEEKKTQYICSTITRIAYEIQYDIDQCAPCNRIERYFVTQTHPAVCLLSRFKGTDMSVVAKRRCRY